MPFINLDPAFAAPAPVSTAGAPLTSVGETLATFRTDLAKELGSRGDVSEDDLNGWINKGYQYLASILVIKELFAHVSLSLVANQPMYLVPSNLVYIEDLSLIDEENYPIAGGAQLVKTDADTYRKLPENYSNSSSTDYPTLYFRERTMVVIWRTPVTSYTASMKFKFRPQDLAEETDSPVLPVEFHEALLLRAKHVALRSLKAHTEAGIARNDFVSDLRGVVDSDAQEESNRPSGMRPIRSWNDLNKMR